MNYVLTYFPRILAMLLFSVVWKGNTAIAQSAVTKKIYIAKTGKDSNPGTVDKPYASPSAALESVAKLKESGYKGSVEVLISKGEYHINKPLIVGAELSPASCSAVPRYFCGPAGAA